MFKVNNKDTKTTLLALGIAIGNHSFNRKVEQRHAAKMFGSFPSKFEREMLQLRFGI